MTISQSGKESFPPSVALPKACSEHISIQLFPCLNVLYLDHYRVS